MHRAATVTSKVGQALKVMSGGGVESTTFQKPNRGSIREQSEVLSLSPRVVTSTCQGAGHLAEVFSFFRPLSEQLQCFLCRKQFIR